MSSAPLEKLKRSEKFKRGLKRGMIMSAKSLYALFLLYLLSFAMLWLLPASPLNNPHAHTEINDVTLLNPIQVGRVYRPTSTQEVSELLSRTHGPVSIGGGRYSMGGQIGADASLHLDMRGMDDILELNAEERWVRVEAGVTWRKLIKHIDPHELSVQVMQSYANFTVGGAVSVNAHGRYMGQGAVVHSVREMTVVLASGERVRCSRDERPELFFAVVGGYGGLGVITELTLNLDEQVKLKRIVTEVKPEGYLPYFREHVEGKSELVMHNADFFPPHYDRLFVTNWSKTDDPVTEEARFQARGEDPFIYRAYRFAMGWIPGGQRLRPWLESIRQGQEVVEWRNYEASYDVASLGEIADEDGSYILREYFVPIERAMSFKKELVRVLQEHEVDVVNVSIRHAVSDPHTLLSWAPQESLAFVLYYHQGSSEEAREAVGAWTKELRAEVVKHGGTYYLPYQIWRDPELFKAAYPRADEYFRVKATYDPQTRFTNRLLEAYGPPSLTQRIEQIYQQHKLSKRDEQQSFLTIPEWFLVYLSEDQARLYSAQRPRDFGYFSGLLDFYSSYVALTRAAKARHPSMNMGYHFMITTIGIVTSAEYALKGAYEHTVGRLFGLFGDEQACESERFIGETYIDYARFINATPWFYFPWGERLSSLWSRPSSGGLHCWERRLSFSAELIAKNLLSHVFNVGNEAIYDTEELKIALTLRGSPARVRAVEPKAELIAPLQGEAEGEGERARELNVWRVPRYTRFTELVRALKGEIDLIEVAGNRWMVASLIAPQGCELNTQELITTTRVQGDDHKRRLIALLPVPEITQRLRERPCLTLEHLYDY